MYHQEESEVLEHSINEIYTTVADTFFVLIKRLTVILALYEISVKKNTTYTGLSEDNRGMSMCRINFANGNQFCP